MIVKIQVKSGKRWLTVDTMDSREKAENEIAYLRRCSRNFFRLQIRDAA